MQLSEFQAASGRTSGGPQATQEQRFVAALGLAGEAGEVVDLLKKHLGHGHPLDKAKLEEELGDVLWYVADVATHYGLDLDDVARANIRKLTRRYPNGFNKADSLARGGS